MSELCDAFKVRHLHESQNLGAGGKTPYGAGGRTPARTPGHRTPGHATPGRMSVHIGRTPNPYQAGGATPAWAAPPAPQPPSAWGYQTPAQYPPQTAQQPAGMNPERAAMIQKSGGWTQGQGW